MSDQNDKGKMKRIVWPITGLIIIILCLSFIREPVLKALGSFLLVQDGLKKADVVVVLGGGGSNRVVEAARLYKQGFAKYIIVTGGSTDQKTNLAAMMEHHAVHLGVPQENILLEPQAMSTYQHPGLVMPIMRAHGFKSAIVVSSPYHMRRSAMLFDRVFKNNGIELIYYPAQESQFKVEEWWKQTRNWKIVRSEYMKMAVNVFGNRVNEFVFNLVEKVK